MDMLNYAVIDLGSNTIRLCVYRYADGVIKTILNQKETAGLASYVSDGVLQPEGIDRACEVLKVFGMVIDNFVEPSNAHVIATASLRNIDNSDEAVEIIQRRTGMAIHVLSGEDEAMLDFIGASYRVPCDSGLLVDIGGASTELVLIQDNRPEMLKSLPIGSLNLYARFVTGFFPDFEERRQIKREVARHVSSVAPKEGGVPVMIGVGGTLKAAYKLACALYHIPPERRELTAEDVRSLWKRFKSPDSTVFHAVYKTVPERGLTIVPGLILLRQIIGYFECSTIRISEYGVREGYLIDRVIRQK